VAAVATRTADQPTPARAPTPQPSTFGPRASITPITSWPGMRG
jgi:hypothetical protein